MSDIRKAVSAKPALQGDFFLTNDATQLSRVEPDLWARLARSDFRKKFHLGQADRAYLANKGFSTILDHGADFIARRLAPAHPVKDGRQTPWKGHPVFVAQHATGTCCRSCLEKWHGFGKGRALSGQQQAYILAVIAEWLCQEEKRL